MRVAGEEAAALVVLEQEGDAAAVRLRIIALELLLEELVDGDLRRAEDVARLRFAEDVAGAEAVALFVHQTGLLQLLLPLRDEVVELLAVRREQRKGRVSHWFARQLVVDDDRFSAERQVP